MKEKETLRNHTFINSETDLFRQDAAIIEQTKQID